MNYSNPQIYKFLPWEKTNKILFRFQEKGCESPPILSIMAFVFSLLKDDLCGHLFLSFLKTDKKRERTIK